MRLELHALGFALLMSVQLPVGAAWLSMCSGPETSKAVQRVDASGPDGRQRSIELSETPPPGCTNLGLPFAASEVLAVHPVPAALPGRIRRELRVTGTVRQGRVSIAGVAVGGQRLEDEHAGAARPPIKVFEDLLPGMGARAYGVEERVQFTRSASGLLLHCRPGGKPAGVVLRAPGYLPRADLSLEVTGRGAGVFELALADRRTQHLQTDPSPAGKFVATGPARQSFQLTAGGLNRKDWDSLSIGCPMGQAQLTVQSIRFTGPDRAAPGRATWVWDPQAWQERPGSVLTHAINHGIEVLYITVRVQDGAVERPQALASFAGSARQRGIHVWAVDGDPRMVLPEEHARTVERLRAYVAYNRGVEASAAIHGVQFDIEPYLLPAYGAAPSEWDGHYVSLVKKLHQAAEGLPLDLAIPYWWDDKTALLAGIAPYVSGLNIMNYQTDPDRIYRSAVPFLDWGSAWGKAVRIALEAGPVDAEHQWTYSLAASGALWLVNVGDVPVVILLRNSHRNPHGRSFRLTGTRTSLASHISFRGNEARLKAMLPELEAQLAAWTAFRGVAVHGLHE